MNILERNGGHKFASVSFVSYWPVRLWAYDEFDAYLVKACFKAYRR